MCSSTGTVARGRITNYIYYTASNYIYLIGGKEPFIRTVVTLCPSTENIFAVDKNKAPPAITINTDTPQ